MIKESSNILESMQPFWGKWYLGSILGSGSAGIVYEIHKKNGETAALKHIHIPIPKDKQFKTKESQSEYLVQRKQEVFTSFNLAQSLRPHKNIISHDEILSSVTETSADILIRMEKCTPLRQYAETYGMSERSIMRLGIDICTALTACHTNNILHSDIKPDNIFSHKGSYKLGDFNSAQIVSSPNATIRGSLSTIAPEAIIGNADIRSDIYSLGMTLYLLLNNWQHPFSSPEPIVDAETWYAALKTRLEGHSLPKPKLGSKPLVRIIKRACSFYPEQRYQTAADMKDDLQAFIDSASKKAFLQAPINRTLDFFKTSLGTLFLTTSTPSPQFFGMQTIVINPGQPFQSRSLISVAAKESHINGSSEKTQTYKLKDKLINTINAHINEIRTVFGWLLFSLLLSLIPLLVYILFSILRKDADIELSVLHELSYLPIVLLTSALKDLLSSSALNSRKRLKKVLLWVVIVPLVISFVIFLFLVFSEATNTAAQLHYARFVNISIVSIVVSILIGITIEIMGATP